MSDTIYVRIDPNSPGLERLQEIIWKVKDPSSLMKKIASLMLTIVRENFQAGGRPPWPPRKSGGTHRLLWKTGRLIGSLHQESTSTSAAVSTNVEYAAVHQFGYQFPPRVIKPVKKKALFWEGAAHPVKKVNHPGSKIPARPFMVIPDSEFPRITETVEKYLNE